MSWELRRRPGQLLRSLTAMDLVMPLLAVGLAKAFGLNPAVQIALVALSLSPVPPFLPMKELKASGSSTFVFGLMVAAALFAIVFIPLALQVIGLVFGLPIHLSPMTVVSVVGLTVLAPLAAGMLVRALAPTLAGRLARPLSLAAIVALGLTAITVLVVKWPGMLSLIGGGALLAFAVFVVVGLAAGHFLGGPREEDRTVLAFSTATRHPGVALAIANANFPDNTLVMPAVALYLIVATLVSLPYARWRRGRVGTGEASAAKTA